MIDCIYGLLVLHRLMFDWEFMVVFCPSTLNDSLECSPIEQQTKLGKPELSMIAGNVKQQLTELSLNLAIKHLTRFFNLCLPPAPSPVTVIKKEKTSRNSVSLSWQQPERPNGIILDYEIKYYEKVGPVMIAMTTRGCWEKKKEIKKRNWFRTNLQVKHTASFVMKTASFYLPVSLQRCPSLPFTP